MTYDLQEILGLFLVIVIFHTQKYIEQDIGFPETQSNYNMYIMDNTVREMLEKMLLPL